MEISIWRIEAQVGTKSEGALASGRQHFWFLISLVDLVLKYEGFFMKEESDKRKINGEMRIIKDRKYFFVQSPFDILNNSL